MHGEFWEQADPSGDPLEILLRREEAEDEAEALTSQYHAGCYVTNPKRSSDDREYVEPTFH